MSAERPCPTCDRIMAGYHTAITAQDWVLALATLDAFDEHKDEDSRHHTGSVGQAS